MNLLEDTLTDPDFVTGDYTVTRQGAPTYVDNLPVPAATSTLSTGPAALHPAGLVLKMLPEGHHVQGSWILFSTVALQLEPVPDLVTTEHGAMRVVDLHPWTGHGATFYLVGLDKAGLP